ncbi:hypothetical protein [Microvirga splendida]|uniref:CHAT domain-containing protein n=1 Tax=Microvirga splendida TaxID=2795727 RepID=A0ABS0Y6R6_9HYPH|nr:hypothetical protein [Microvirga splendida]MBJ6127981.1 hypothetical protein [Microvirga splendida]
MRIDEILSEETSVLEEVTQPKRKTKPQVFIIESLTFEDEANRREGEIIERSLKMIGKDPQYHYVRTYEEFEHFINVFNESSYRYLHLSMHGSKDGFDFTIGDIGISEFSRLVGPALDGKRLFISACSAATTKLARNIFSEGKCNSVVGPAEDIAFGDAAVFWTALYHLMFKANRKTVDNKLLKLNLVKTAFMMQENFNLFTRKKDSVEPRVYPVTAKGRTVS